jgi:mono/diheme cytochrome c family protein
MRASIPVLLATAFAAGSAFAQADQQLVAQGKSILDAKCARCHQTGEKGRSKLAAAPPFRDVMKRYRPEVLEEALGEGLTTGHPGMPEFVFEPDEISAILAYLETLRTKR